MKKAIFLSFLFMLMAVVSGCSGSKNVSDIPDWYVKPPVEDENLYGIGEGNGPDLGLTRTGAEAAARDDIARQIDIKVNNLIRRSAQQVGQEIDISVQQNISKQIVSQSLKECKIVERKILESEGKYRIFCLAKMSLSALREDAKANLKNKEVMRQLAMHELLQKELDKEIEKLDGTREK